MVALYPGKIRIAGIQPGRFLIKLKFYPGTCCFTTKNRTIGVLTNGAPGIYWYSIFNEADDKPMTNYKI